MCIRDSHRARLHQSVALVVDVSEARQGRDVLAAVVGTEEQFTPGVEGRSDAVSYTHLRAHETVLDLVCRLLLEKKHKQPIPAT